MRRNLIGMLPQIHTYGPGGRPGKAQGFGFLEPLLGVFSLLLVIFTGQSLLALFTDNGPDHLLQKSSLVSHLEYARQEAVRREATVTICPSEDGRSCQVGGDWQQGWLIFTDDAQPSHHLSVGDIFLHRQKTVAEKQPELAFDTIRYQADGSILLN